MSSETEDSDIALKPGPRSNLLHPEKKNARKDAAEGKERVMDKDTDRDGDGGLGT